LEIVKRILAMKKKVDMKVKCQGKTCAEIAKSKGHTAVFQILTDYEKKA